MTTDQLKACPFCGSDAIPADDWLLVECKKCNYFIELEGYTIDEGPKDYMIRKWNTRAQAEDGDGEAVAHPVVRIAGIESGEHTECLCKICVSRPRAQEGGEDARDAARYRWLREHFKFSNDSMAELWFDICLDSTPTESKELDSSIDEIMPK